MGHRRRYSAEAARKALESQGFETERVWEFNKAGAPPWWVYGKLAGSRRINKLTLKIFDKTVWIWRRIDGIMPWHGLSLIVVGRKSSAPDVAGNGASETSAFLSQQTV
jgi:hypothetical protein